MVMIKHYLDKNLNNLNNSYTKLKVMWALLKVKMWEIKKLYFWGIYGVHIFMVAIDTHQLSFLFTFVKFTLGYTLPSRSLSEYLNGCDKDDYIIFASWTKIFLFRKIWVCFCFSITTLTSQEFWRNFLLCFLFFQ